MADLTKIQKKREKLYSLNWKKNKVYILNWNAEMVMFYSFLVCQNQEDIYVICGVLVSKFQQFIKFSRFFFYF
jgi:hypothetical protein